jgi:integrase
MKRREEGSIVEREKGRKYLIRWTSLDKLTGENKRHNKIVKGDYVEAQSELSKVLRPDVAADHLKPIEGTFSDYAEREWAQYTSDNWKESTQIVQGSFVRVHIVAFFGGMLLSRIKPTNIVEFHTAAEKKGLSRKTRRNLHAILTKMFSYALDLELIPSNPVKRGTAPKLEKTEKPILTETQLNDLFGQVPIQYKAFFMTLAMTGIRIGEALGLKWADVDFAEREIHVRRAIYRSKETTPKTVNSKRSRPMVEKLYRALLNHRAISAYTTQADYVFASSTGRPFNPDQLRQALRDALNKLGVQMGQKHAYGMHLLRHTSGSVAYKHTGGDVKATQEWLGHSSSRITLDTYTHLMKDAQRETARTLEKAVFDQPETPTSTMN